MQALVGNKSKTRGHCFPVRTILRIISKSFGGSSSTLGPIRDALLRCNEDGAMAAQTIQSLLLLAFNDSLHRRATACIVTYAHFSLSFF